MTAKGQVLGGTIGVSFNLVDVHANEPRTTLFLGSESCSPPIVGRSLWLLLSPSQSATSFFNPESCRQISFLVCKFSILDAARRMVSHALALA